MARKQNIESWIHFEEYVSIPTLKQLKQNMLRIAHFPKHFLSIENKIQYSTKNPQLFLLQNHDVAKNLQLRQASWNHYNTESNKHCSNLQTTAFNQIVQTWLQFLCSLFTSLFLFVLFIFLSFCGRWGCFPCSYAFFNYDKEIRPTKFFENKVFG